MQPPSPEQDILCYPVHACMSGSDYEPLACIQNTEYVHWSTDELEGTWHSNTQGIPVAHAHCRNLSHLVLVNAGYDHHQVQ
uniref:SINA6 n=1 Tax=Arundo donax TaxID=35708 RepID=A0A0A9RV55_ARUDO